MFFSCLQVGKSLINPITVNPRHGGEGSCRFAGNGSDVFTKSANHALSIVQDRGNGVVHGVIVSVVVGWGWSACA